MSSQPRGGGSTNSCRSSSSARENPAYGAFFCSQKEYQEYAPLKGFQLAQEWCQYSWPKPAVTTTCTVDKKHPTPTTITPPKAHKPQAICSNHDSLCRVFESLRAVDGSDDNDLASCIWYAVSFPIIDRNESFTHAVYSSCIEIAQTVLLLVENIMDPYITTADW